MAHVTRRYDDDDVVLKFLALRPTISFGDEAGYSVTGVDVDVEGEPASLTLGLGGVRDTLVAASKRGASGCYAA